MTICWSPSISRPKDLLDANFADAYNVGEINDFQIVNLTKDARYEKLWEKKQLPRIRPDLEIVSDDDLVCAVLVLIYYASRQQQIALSLESSNDTLLNSWEKANSKKAELVGFKVDPMQKSMQKNWNWLQLIFPINLGCNMICCCYCQSTNHLVWKN